MKRNNKIFLVDEGKSYSYKDLLNEINNWNFYQYHTTSDPFKFFVNLIKGLALNQDVTIIDFNLPQETLNSISASYNINFSNFISKQNNYTEIQSLIDKIKKSQSNITLFTSGTTGLPKQVKHKISLFKKSIIKSSEEFIWALAYNPSHIAGLSVFFQAFFNFNTIVYIYNKEKNSIVNLIKDYEITHISATPTFYRLLFPIEPDNLSSVKRITLGGEKSDSKLIAELSRAFSNAKINNIYATTEFGSLFISKNENFIINDDLKKNIKIIDSELLIHKKIIGEIAGVDFMENTWYRTGDLVEIINHSPLEIRFLFRKNNMINVGGEKINPEEVEDNLLKIFSIIQARVYGRKNSVLGNILCAELVVNSEISEKEIRNLLSKSLPNYKIPRFFTFVNKIEMSSSTKIKRK